MRLTRLLILLPLVLAGCPPAGGEDHPLPPEAWGPAADTPALPGAVMLTQEELDEISLTQDVYEAPPPDLEGQARAQQEAMDADEEVVRAWLSERGIEGTPLNDLLDAPPELGAADRELPDGNYEIELPDLDGKRVVTLGRPSLLRGLRATLDRVDDPENSTRAYRLLYEQFPASIQQLQLPTPDEVDAYGDVDKLQALVAFQALEGRLLALLAPGGVAPRNRPVTCGGEVEAFENWDRQNGNADSEAHSSGGIYANFQWPQKWYATCVKDQANRGTCGAFGITAAMETGIALKFDRWVNLSEQDLYYHVRGQWNPVAYGDGIAVHPEWQHMLANNYLLPFESQWPYNRSGSRIANDTLAAYTHSCDGYQWFDPSAGLIPNYCSDTVHQGGAYCMNVLWFQVCGYASAVSSANTSGYRAGNEVEVWNAANPGASLSVTRLALAGKLPTVLWAPVTWSFDHPDANGFAPYLGLGEGNRGSHIYQVTGFVDNAALQQQLPNGPARSGRRVHHRQELLG